jgi:hypothetical protein
MPTILSLLVIILAIAFLAFLVLLVFKIHRSAFEHVLISSITGLPNMVLVMYMFIRVASGDHELIIIFNMDCPPHDHGARASAVHALMTATRRVCASDCKYLMRKANNTGIAHGVKYMYVHPCAPIHRMAPCSCGHHLQ